MFQLPSLWSKNSTVFYGMIWKSSNQSSKHYVLIMSFFQMNFFIMSGARYLTHLIAHTLSSYITVW
uniref:Uncharacterized protein n=1 Tax=Arundo donax TaxID=35708 RepID=A0A0A9FDI5_ARUDO